MSDDPAPSSDPLFRAIFEQAAVAVGLLDSETGRILRVNRKYEELIGYTQAELCELDFMRLTYPEDLAEDLAQMDRLQRGDIGDFSIEKRLVKKGGAPVWVRLTVSALRSPSGVASQHIAVLEDIGARRCAEVATREALGALESTLAALPDLLFDVDDEGRLHDIRAPRPELLVRPKAELIGQRLVDYLPPEAFEVIGPALREAMTTGRTTTVRYRLVIDGDERWFDASIARKEGAAGRPRAIAIARDVTAQIRSEARRQALEAQLRQSQKLEAVGTLAGGVAHDFNNLLAAIGLGVELARRGLPPEHASSRALDDVDRSVQRATLLVQQILSFSRKRPASRAPCSLARAVDEATRLLRATLPAGVSLDTSLAELPAVWADATQLQQVLVNLGTNAWQAMPRGAGNITFSTRQERVPAGHPALAAGLYGVLRVADDGEGMSAAVRERVFEPFFTTKPPGQGSGLGLTVVHGIVRDHGGWIDLRSEAGAGTTIDVFLAAAAVDAADEPAPSSARLQGRGARVLCVDDEVSLLTPLVEVLTSLGYAATPIADPREALAVFRAAPHDFDALLTDLTMPGLSGLELAQEIAALRPGLPVVLMSGFTPEGLGLAAGVGARIGKPFEVGELTQVLGGLLAAPRARG
ncbi:MAG: PAS domain S-box protein [Polyangiaceae bacterium]|nr:PAS domain S-box protein [Polyangiaceae bacterium]